MELTDLQSYDWKNVFAYASGIPESGYSATPGAVGEDPVATTPFGIDDVAQVLHAVEGENDGPNWVIVVLLKDGRYASINAGCDYTGWDCQAGGTASVASSYEQIVRFGLGDNDRSRLFISLVGIALKG